MVTCIFVFFFDVAFVSIYRNTAFLLFLIAIWNVYFLARLIFFFCKSFNLYSWLSVSRVSSISFASSQ